MVMLWSCDGHVMVIQVGPGQMMQLQRVLTSQMSCVVVVGLLCNGCHAPSPVLHTELTTFW